jgi:hypothetical protein
MAKRETVSLAPLTPDQAMRALLKVDPKDVKKLEARERQEVGGEEEAEGEVTCRVNSMTSRSTSASSPWRLAWSWSRWWCPY